MKYKTYPEYKNSGVEWLGEIPSEWKPIRYKYILNIFQGNAFKSSDYVNNSNVVNIRMGNIKKGGSIDLNHNLKYLPETYPEQYKNYKLKNGDVIIAMTDMSPSLEFLAVPATLENLDADKTYLLNQRVGKLHFNKNIDSNYVKYSLLSYELREYFKSSGLGTIQANMSNDNLYQACISYPPLQEQKTIANYLDKATAKIDTLVEKQTKLIELLKEKRQAIISTAVTRGLDSSVAMKDSGVEWLGDVPEGWTKVSMKWISNIYAGGTPDKTNLSYWTNGTVPWINSGEVNQFYITKPTTYITEEAYSNSSAKWIEADSLVMALAGQGKTKGMVARLGIRTTCNQSMAAIETVSEYESRFLLWWITANYQRIRNMAGGDLRDGLNLDLLGNIPCPFMSLEEQVIISNYLDDKTSKIGMLITKATKAIDLLKEKRTALISSVVTGKIDVRETA